MLAVYAASGDCHKNPRYRVVGSIFPVADYGGEFFPALQFEDAIPYWFEYRLRLLHDIDGHRNFILVAEYDSLKECYPKNGYRPDYDETFASAHEAAGHLINAARVFVDLDDARRHFIKVLRDNANC